MELFLVAVAGIAVYLVFKLFRALFQTWKISLPVIAGVIALVVFIAKGTIKLDDANGFFAIVVFVAIFIISRACHARCPRCRTFTIRRVGERQLSTSGVFQRKCGDGKYHSYHKITGEKVYRCKKCGFEKTSGWTKTERLDD